MLRNEGRGLRGGRSASADPDGTKRYRDQKSGNDAANERSDVHEHFPVACGNDRLAIRMRSIECWMQCFAVLEPVPDHPNQVNEVHLLASEADDKDGDERLVTDSRDDAIEQMFPTRQQMARTHECLLIKISIFNFDLNVTLVTASNIHLGVLGIPAEVLIEGFNFPAFAGVEDWNDYCCIRPHIGGVVAPRWRRSLRHGGLDRFGGSRRIWVVCPEG